MIHPMILYDSFYKFSHSFGLYTLLALAPYAVLRSRLGSPDFTVRASTQGTDADEAVLSHPHFRALGVVLTFQGTLQVTQVVHLQNYQLALHNFSNKLVHIT